MPDGPCELWAVISSTDRQFMGASPAGARPAWRWRGGKLCLDYSPVRVTVRDGGWYESCVLCAVTPAVHAYRAMWRLSLGKPAELRPGDNITITDGVIEIQPGDTDLHLG